MHICASGQYLFPDENPSEMRQNCGSGMGCVFYHDIFIRTIIPEYYKFRIFDNFLVLSFKNSCLPSWPLHWHSVGSWGAQGFRGKQGA